MDTKSNKTVLHSEQYDRIRSSAVFQNFKYIKTFTPIRRPTTSYAATIRFMEPQIEKEGRIVADDLTARMLNRSFMVDPWDRLYRDSVLVRFEDGKLNPKATFTALAEFLDLPYTQSMTYCSGASGIDPESLGREMPAALTRLRCIGPMMSLQMVMSGHFWNTSSAMSMKPMDMIFTIIRASRSMKSG